MPNEQPDDARDADHERHHDARHEHANGLVATWHKIRKSPARSLRSTAAGLKGTALAAPAQAAEVVSSNIVGYQKITLTAGYQMIGVQFTQVGGTAKDIGTVGTCDATMAGFDEDGNYPTEMRVWNGLGYDYYGWAGTSGTDVADEPSLDNQWLDFNTMEPGVDPMATGAGFWIKTDSSGTLTISGEVPSGATVQVPLVAGYNIVANPYPAEVEIGQFGILDASFAGFDEDGNYPTEMRVWNGLGYDYYGWAGTSGTDVADEPSLDNQWLDFNTMEPSTQKLPYGTAVWIKAEKAGTITFSAPSAN